MDNESQLECLTLFPAPPCGFFGSCSEDRCFCPDGFRATNEMNVYFVDDKEQGFCQNVKALSILHMINLLFCIVLFMAYLLATRKPKRVLKQWAFYVTLILAFTASLMKLLAPGKAEFGEDFLFTFIVAQKFVLDYQQTTTYVERYMLYLRRTIQVSPVMNPRELAFYEGYAGSSRVIDAVNHQFLWISTLFGRPTNQIIVRAALGATFFRTCFSIVSVWRTLGGYRSDLKRILQGSPRGQIVDTIETIEAVFTQVTSHRKNSMVYVAAWFVYGPIPALFPLALQYFPYFIVISFMAFNLLSVGALRVALAGRH